MEARDFIPYEQALVLKELGFDEPCFGYYVGLGDNKEELFKLVEIQSEKGQFEWVDNVYHAPTFSQAFRFFRERYGILYNIFFIDIYNINKYSCSLKANYNKKWTHLGFIDNVETYEEAELECLKKLIEIIKNDRK